MLRTFYHSDYLVHANTSLLFTFLFLKSKLVLKLISWSSEHQYKHIAEDDVYKNVFMYTTILNKFPTWSLHIFWIVDIMIKLP